MEVKATSEKTICTEADCTDDDSPQSGDTLFSTTSPSMSGLPGTPAARQNRDCLEFVRSELSPDKRLIPLKIFAFLFYGGMYAAVPYFTLHMQQVGLTIKEIAVIYSVLPVPAIVGPIISGIIADRTAKFKVVLLTNIVLTIILTLAVAFIPPVDNAGPTSLAFNTSGVAFANFDCRSAEGSEKYLTCSSTCFSEVFEEVPYDSYEIVCSSIDVTRQVPLEGCFFPSPEDPDCGKRIEFSPALGKVMPYKVHKESDIFIERDCTFYCMSGDTKDYFVSSEMSNSKTFWLYLLLRVAGMLFIKSSFSMMDASIMAVMLRTGGDYGKQRLVAMLSMATFPFVASCIVEYLSAGSERMDYAPVFYLMACLLLLSLGVCLFVDLQVEHKVENKVLKNVAKLISRADVIFFLVIIFLLGVHWGYIEQYLFVYLKTLDASTYMLGLTLTFGCLIGMPMLLVSDRIIEKVGRHRVFFIGFLAYSVRMFGYSAITNPWYCFFFEALEVFTYQIMWVAAVTYFPILAPHGLLGTMAGLAGATHFNIGRGGGGFIGGILISSVGMVWTFRVFGVASLVLAFIYLFLQKTVFRSTLLKERKSAVEEVHARKGKEAEGLAEE